MRKFLFIISLFLWTCGSGSTEPEPPQLPTVQNINLIGIEDTPKVFTFVGTDPLNLALSYSISTQPQHGTVVISGASGTYTPNANYNGQDTFLYLASTVNGNSNIGKIKELYRKGLELRYGPSMQCVAGIHYNFSLHPSSLKILLSSFGVQHSNDLYLSLIRNFKRYYWFILIHFGRSSIIDKSFIRGREHKLVKLNDCDLFMKYATSLRMSDIGYKSSAQKNLKIKYNSLNEFLDKVRDAVIQPHEGFAKLGHRDENGDFKQISTGIIQIENELYDEIRPKRSLKDNKRPYHLLKKEGIEYIEVRGIDLNPDESIGISLNQILFLNVFLLWCAINESPLISDSEYRRIENNNNSVIQNGNDFSSLLEVKGGKKEINESMSDIFHELEILANELDDRKYILAIKEIKNNNYNFNMNDTFHNFALKKSIEHSNRFNSYKLNKEIFDKFNKQALNSINEFNKINNKTESSFENYVNSYNKKLKEGDI